VYFLQKAARSLFRQRVKIGPNEQSWTVHDRQGGTHKDRVIGVVLRGTEGDMSEYLMRMLLISQRESVGGRWHALDWTTHWTPLLYLSLPY
jgi:hypothetical protein